MMAQPDREDTPEGERRFVGPRFTFKNEANAMALSMSRSHVAFRARARQTRVQTDRVDATPVEMRGVIAGVALALPFWGIVAAVLWRPGP
jgi:hypothetical protein